MTKRMLIDTTHAEETRVVVLDGNRLDDYDVETSAKKQIKGNIYLAKIVRIEPSLQAAFVEYGGNRHGFLAFSEIHPDYYQIPVADRERLIALQEEEARAEEARADREDEDETAGEPQRDPLDAPSDAGRDDAPEALSDTSDASGTESTSVPLEIDADTIEADAEPATAISAEVEPVDAPTGTEQAEEPAPETVGGENGDDGQAQRRTARFLRQYKIQEVMRRRQILLIQVVKEERGNKGAALTTYISLAGRFCVLMPNSLRGGGVSRKITSAADRRRLKEITNELDIPRGMGMIVRTAGAQRPRPEIRRDCEYLLRTWDDIRETTLASVAPCLVYEEASLIKRAIRDVYTRDVEEIVVDGETGWRAAREFMRTLMPAHASKVNLWRDPAQKLFSAYQVEHHLDAMLQPTVQLRSGGYLVINQTEALVAIDVNSGRSTRERGIEETALRTNLEAADEVARQLRLRDLAGLIVIDFIDMEARRNNAMVERRLKDALRNDRARIQVGSISHFGLMEMSRQRLRPSLAESSFVPCPHCAGSGFMRGTESSALHVLRAIEEEAGKRKAAEILVYAASSVALYVLNNKRSWLQEIESHHNLTVQLAADDSLIPPTLRIERIRPYVAPAEPVAPPAAVTHIPIDTKAPIEADPAGESWTDEQPEIVAAPPSPVAAVPALGESEGDEASRRRKRRRRRRGGRREDGTPVPESAEAQAGSDEDDGESDLGPVFESEPGEPDVAVVAAAAEPLPQDDGTAAAVSDATPETVPDDVPADAAPRGRRRRGGGRNRVRPDIDDTAVLDTAPVDDTDQPRRAPRAYVGPTPADPFAGSFDIFEMIEREAEENLALAPDPSASAASLASGPTVVPAPAAPPAAAEAETLPLPEPASQPVVPSLAEPLAASAAEPAGEPKAKLPTTSLSQTPPDSVPDPVPDAEPAADADTVPVAEADTAPPAKAARVAKPRKPRASRAKKPVLAEPVAEPAAGDAVSDTAPQTPEAVPDAPDAPQPVPVTVHPEPDNAAPEPQGASEPEAEPDAAAPAASDRSIVQPIVIGSDSPAPARRTGWWKR